MVELRVVLSDETAEDLAARAREERTTPEQLASQAVQTFLDAALLSPLSAGRLPRFVGKGRSGRDDLSERVEEILSAELGS